MQQLLAKGGEAMQQQVSAALADAHGTAVQTRADVQDLTNKGAAAVRTAVAAGRLTAEEANQLAETVRMSASTEFGKRNEDAAIVRWAFSDLKLEASTRVTNGVLLGCPLSYRFTL
jgi:hypothetical protein